MHVPAIVVFTVNWFKYFYTHKTVLCARIFMKFFFYQNKLHDGINFSTIKKIQGSSIPLNLPALITTYCSMVNDQLSIGG